MEEDKKMPQDDEQKKPLDSKEESSAEPTHQDPAEPEQSTVHGTESDAGQGNKDDSKSELKTGDKSGGKKILAKELKKETVEGEWYVLHTYSGYEDAVANDLGQRIESLDMGGKIFEVLVPKEKQVEIKHGKRKTVEKKIFPGYVMVRMVYTPDSWFVVRNTQNVTGFIGSGVIPVPVTPDEVKSIRKRMAIEDPTFDIQYEVGETVHITDGPFKEYDGTVQEIDGQRGKLKVMVSIFGRETPVELDFLQIKRVGEG